MKINGYKAIDTWEFKNRPRIKEWLKLNGYASFTLVSEEVYLKYIMRFKKINFNPNSN